MLGMVGSEDSRLAPWEPPWGAVGGRSDTCSPSSVSFPSSRDLHRLEKAPCGGSGGELVFEGLHVLVCMCIANSCYPGGGVVMKGSPGCVLDMGKKEGSSEVSTRGGREQGNWGQHVDWGFHRGEKPLRVPALGQPREPASVQPTDVIG